jgi:uncharacterized protein
MPLEHLTLLLLGIFTIAMLYSAVGHGGASGYIAVMSLMGLAPALIKPSALMLNILVASIGTWQFVRAGHFSWRLFWPFAVLAPPAAFLGAYVTLPGPALKVLLGLVLLYSAVRLLVQAAQREKSPVEAPLWLALFSGAAIGFLSGLTGTGGGIFLTPLLLLMGWATPKRAAAVSALFILINSVAGLLGYFSSTQALPPFGLALMLAAGLGGLIGSQWGSFYLAPQIIKRFLAVVLLMAGGKLLFLS